DGANRFQRMLHIDLPAIMPTATILLVMRCGSILDLGFEKAYLMQNNLNLSTSEVISTYVYKVGMVTGGGNFSFGTAVGLLNSIVNFVLLVLVNFCTKRLGGNSLW
ncbi:MAG: sugar ABC transporter permease, partial [Eubacteriales bacterium]|nr:sugar ABC transporter permease [Eubacteriales bacterium]